MPGRTRPGRRRSRWAGRLPIPRVLAVGASTGRPQALSLFLGRLSPHLDNVPVLIVLHMPPDFTDVVRGHIERATGRPTHAALNSERIRPGEIYFAPGNRHLKAAKLDTTPILLHCDSAPENFCRPAVNVLFRSVAQVYGPGTLAIVLRSRRRTRAGRSPRHGYRAGSCVQRRLGNGRRDRPKRARLRNSSDRYDGLASGCFVEQA